MFNFFSMQGNYEERKVDNYEKDNIVIDTCRVTDSLQPYETGVCHPKYNNGNWIIVEMYDTKEDAKKGHDKWVKKMTSSKPPKQLKDVSNCEIMQFGNAIGIDNPIYKAE